MAAGAVLGFSGYFMQPGLNRDTFAPAFLAAGMALVGLLVGGVLSMLTGWALARAGRRSQRAGLWPALLNVLLWLGLFYILQAALPGWLQRPQAPAVALPHINPCQQPPPTDTRERKSWDEECR
jgi:hypothetical protein